MRHRRRKGASAAGIVALLLAVPATADPARLGAEAIADLARRDQPVTAEAVPVRLLQAEALAAPRPAAPPPPLPHCPVQGAVTFVDSWGNGRSGGRRHQGVDMLAAQGTPVVAPVDGVVTNRDNRVGGLSYHLYADDGTYYYGTHLSDYGATGRVAAGTVIGYVGDTGNARGTPHLHFEVHPGGEGTPAVNPYDTAAAWCTAERVVEPGAPPGEA